MLFSKEVGPGSVPAISGWSSFSPQPTQILPSIFDMGLVLGEATAAGRMEKTACEILRRSTTRAWKTHEHLRWKWGGLLN